LASVIVKAKDPDAVTIVLPADHIIRDEDKFKKVLENAAKYADDSKGLVTIGITTYHDLKPVMDIFRLTIRQSLTISTKF
jgi:mannose-1-phosphate guanylyltransferase